MRELVVKGAQGEKLIFDQLRVEGSEKLFRVSVDVGWAQGHADATTFVNGSPAALFERAAEHWKGWTGELSWAELEGRVEFHATMDRVGHVTLSVTMKDSQCTGQLLVDVSLEAGQLSTITADLKEFFGEKPVSD